MRQDSFHDFLDSFRARCFDVTNIMHEAGPCMGGNCLVVCDITMALDDDDLPLPDTVTGKLAHIPRSGCDYFPLSVFSRQQMLKDWPALSEWL